MKGIIHGGPALFMIDDGGGRYSYSCMYKGRPNGNSRVYLGDKKYAKVNNEN